MLYRNSEQLNINNVHFGVVKSLKIRYFFRTHGDLKTQDEELNHETYSFVW